MIQLVIYLLLIVSFFVRRVSLDSMVIAQFGGLLLYAQCSGVELFRLKLKSLFLKSLCEWILAFGYFSMHNVVVLSCSGLSLSLYF